jgi:hypothetical protein
MTSTWYVRRLHALDGTQIDVLAVATTNCNRDGACLSPA